MRSILLPLILFLSTAACLIPPTARAEGGDAIELTVVNNDNLINICRRYLEEPGRWREVGRFNRLKDYDLIRSGARLAIPIRLLKGVPADGRVVFLRGVVEVRENPAGPWKRLAPDAVVRQGNLLRTGNDGAVEIAFQDGTGFFLRGDTTLDLHTSQTKGGGHLLQRLYLSTGRMVTRVRRSTGRDSRIEIPTPTATAVARGTDFRVSVGAEETSSCEVLQGVVDVEAARRQVVVRDGEGTRVRKGEPPMRPRRLLPPPFPRPPGSPVRAMPFRLEFDRIGEAAAYRLLLSRDREGKDAVVDRVIGGKEEPELSGLEDGAYYCRMASIDEIGLEGPSGPPIPMTVRVNPLPPFIREPADGARVKGKAASFRWLKVRDADHYQLQVAPDREFRKAAQGVRDVAGTGDDIAFDEFGVRYFRVRSVAPDGFAGAWSDTVAFTLVPPPPSPEVESPEAKGKELRIRWRDQGGKTTYHLQVARGEDFRAPIVDRKVDRPEVTLPMPTEPGTYLVRTSAIDQDGYEGGFSQPQQFEVKSRWPLAAGALGALGIILLFLL